MPTEVVNYRLRQLFATLAATEAANPILLEGEVWIEKDATTGQSTGRRKVGDGVVGADDVITGTAFIDLPFEPSSGGGGSGAGTDLSYNTGTRFLDSSDGEGVTLPLANALTAGLQDTEDYTLVRSAVQPGQNPAATVFAITDGGSVVINPANGALQTWTLGANRTPSATFAEGASCTIHITAGAFTINWATVAVTWLTGTAPVLAISGITPVTLYRVNGVIYGGSPVDFDSIEIAQSQVTGLATALAGKENTGVAAAAVTAHEGAADPHPGYLTQTEGDGRYRQTATALTDSDIPASIARDSEVTAAITAHEGAADPHPGYLTAAEGNAAYAPVATTNAAVTAGTNAQGSGALTADVNIITTTAANPSGVTLRAAAVNQPAQVVINRGTNPVNVYPTSSVQIDTAGANNPYSLAVGARIDFLPSSTTQWQSSSIERTSVSFLAGTGTGVNTALAVNVGSAGAFVTFNGAGGTPSSLTLTNATGLPLTTGVTGTLAGSAVGGAYTAAGLTMATARLLGRTTASAGAAEEITVGSGLSLSGGTLSATGSGGSITVQDEGSTLSSSVTTINFTGAGVTATGTSTVTVDVPTGGGGGDALVANPLSQFAATTSAQLAGVISDETGSGALVFGTAPALSAATVSTAVTVTAGTNAQGQGALTADFNVITTAAANPSGVTLPTATVGRRVVIVNRGANPVSVYPATSANINALAANASISLPVGTSMEFYGETTTAWEANTISLTSGVAGILPTANGGTGNASGTVATLTTTRTIGGSNFNGSANVTSFPAPGAIGGTTPSTGVFTTLVAGSATSLLLGTAGTAVGSVGFRNATSGTITLAPPTGALGTVTLTLPAITDTLVTLTATQTLTNKTLTSPTLTTPALGVPASGDLANCTGLPLTGLVASTSLAIGVGTIELGAATDTTLSRSAAGVVAVEGVALARVIASGTAALGTTAIASGASATLVTVSATGVLTSDPIIVGFNGNPNSVTGYNAASTTGCLVITAYPTADNVNFLVSNPTASSITPGALTLNWRVVR